MECERHPKAGIVWVGDMEVCYGCYCEQFDYCPLCGRQWDKHPSEGIDYRKEVCNEEVAQETR